MQTNYVDAHENDLGPVSILRLFETTKSERGEFVAQLIERLDNGEADPLTVHLQVKSAEDLIKQITSSEAYKGHTLTAAEKHGKSFSYHNAKFEVKEMGTKYDFTACQDPEWNEMNDTMERLKADMKLRENFLKTIPAKGMPIITWNGEAVTVYPPNKTSTTSVAVTLK